MYQDRMKIVKRNYHDELIVLAHYMGYFIEYRAAQLQGIKQISYEGYNGIVMNRIELFDHKGNEIKPMTFEQYKEWNDLHALFERSFAKVMEEFSY